MMTETYASLEQAERRAFKLIGEKHRKGYVEVGGPEEAFEPKPVTSGVHFPDDFVTRLQKKVRAKWGSKL